jgi:thiamine-phosphate pyrophosphorylase
LRGQLILIMASRGNATEPRRPAPRLYLVTPQDAGGPDAHELSERLTQALLTEALGAADVAAVLVRLPAGDERRQINQLKALAPTVQDKGAALLVDGHAELAARAGADGAHLDGIAAFQAALAALKPARIAGCGGLGTRHDAMLAAEAGADYVMFGEPDSRGRRPSFEAVTERVAWWAELFEIPCVGFAAALDEVEPLAAAGADFVAVGDCVFADARGCAAAVADAAARLATAEAVT